jgi:hypothetical protein
MGFTSIHLSILMEEARRKPLGGSLLTLGVQDVTVTYDLLITSAKHFGVPLKTVDSLTLSADPGHANSGFLAQETFFKMLGFDEVVTVDCSDFEGCNFVYDLNKNSLPSELKGRFDMVMDLGTMEHVFHIPHFFKNIFEALKMGGRVVHTLPSSNFIDHGFYSFSPTLFWDFYRANRFDVNRIDVMHYYPDAKIPAFHHPYRPELSQRFSEGQLKDGLYGTLCIATKKTDSSADQIPQQSSYSENQWLQKNIDSTLRRGFDAVNQKDLTKAQQILTELTQIAPEDYRTWALTSHMLRLAGKSTEAVSAAETAVKKGTAPISLWALYLAYLDKKDVTNAQAVHNLFNRAFPVFDKTLTAVMEARRTSQDKSA